MKAPTLVYIHQYYVSPSAAGGTRSHELSQALAQEGWRVTVITSSAYVNRASARAVSGDGVRIVVLPVPYRQDFGAVRRACSFLAFTVMATLLACLVRGDVVYASSTPLSVALPALARQRLRRTPWVLEVRDVWPDTLVASGLRSAWVIRSLNWLADLSYRYANAVVALSPDMAATIRSRAPGVEVTVAPNAATGRPSASFVGRRLTGASEPIVNHLRTARENHRRTLVYAGTLGRVNDCGYLIEIVRHLARHRPMEYELIFVGTGSQRKALQRKVVEGGLERVVTFVEPVPKSDLPAVLSRASLACSTVLDEPELSANSANKVFDAWGVGTPVLINHGGWIADILVDAGAGVVLPSRPSRQAALDVHEFLSDEARYREARRAALLLIEKEYNWPRIAERVSSVLRTAIAS